MKYRGPPIPTIYNYKTLELTRPTTIMAVINAIGIAMSEFSITTKTSIIVIVVLVSILSALIALLLYYYFSNCFCSSNYAFMILITCITINNSIPICKINIIIHINLK